MPALLLRAVTSPDLRIPGSDPWYADPSDPALSVMTDFRERASVTVAENATMDAALEHMKHNGVRCAFAFAFAIDESRLTHIPVMETGEDGGQRLQGLLSGAKVRRSCMAHCVRMRNSSTIPRGRPSPRRITERQDDAAVPLHQ